MIGHVIFHINSINFGPNIAINKRLFMKREDDFYTYKASSVGYIMGGYRQLP